MLFLNSQFLVFFNILMICWPIKYDLVSSSHLLVHQIGFGDFILSVGPSEGIWGLHLVCWPISYNLGTSSCLMAHQKGFEDFILSVGPSARIWGTHLIYYYWWLFRLTISFISICCVLHIVNSASNDLLQFFLIPFQLTCRHVYCAIFLLVHTRRGLKYYYLKCVNISCRIWEGLMAVFAWGIWSHFLIHLCYCRISWTTVQNEWKECINWFMACNLKKNNGVLVDMS